VALGQPHRYLRKRQKIAMNTVCKCDKSLVIDKCTTTEVTGTFPGKGPGKAKHSEPPLFLKNLNFTRKFKILQRRYRKFPAIQENRQNATLFHETIPLKTLLREKTKCLMKTNKYR
jgi:hypothetical protein